MKKIKSNIVIANIILSLDKNIICIEELMECINEISQNLKNTNYYIEKININYIYEFFRFYTYVGKIENNKIIINENPNLKQRMIKFFLSSLDEDIIELLKVNQKFIFPLIYQNQLIEYHFICTHSKFLSSLKSDFYYDEVKNKNYLLDLEIIKDKIGIENINEFLDSMFINGRFIKKKIFNTNNVIQFVEYLDCLKDVRFQKIKRHFEVEDEFSKINSISNTIFAYYHTALDNAKTLIEIEKLDAYYKKLEIDFK